ncbi:hypothetical protein LCGC14_1771740 [marine sediment metagenome]|uniref:Uncharacterized protein n=1 Tax=marine sediment metagenome TaxID=412755 RepID=A0A0F9GY24_9ZZZZ
MTKDLLQVKITELRNKEKLIPIEERPYLINSLNMIQDQFEKNYKLLAENNLNIIDEILEEIQRLENCDLKRISKKEFLDRSEF